MVLYLIFNFVLRQQYTLWSGETYIFTPKCASKYGERNRDIIKNYLVHIILYSICFFSSAALVFYVSVSWGKLPFRENAPDRSLYVPSVVVLSHSCCIGPVFQF